MKSSVRKTSSQSLAATLALALISLSVLALLVTSSLQLFSNIQTQQGAIASNQRLVAQSAAKTVSGFVSERFNALATASRLADMATASPDTQSRLLQSMLGLEQSFKQLVLFDDQGQMLTYASRLSLTYGKIGEEHLSDIFQQTRQNGYYISPVSIDSITSEPEVILAVPVNDIFGDYHGTLAATVNLKFMWDLVARLDVGESGHAYVVDRNGNLLAFRDTERVLQGDNVADIHTVREFIASPTTSAATHMSSYAGITGNNVVGSYVALGKPDWAVVIEVPWAEAYSGIIHDTVISIVVLAITAIFAGVMGVAIARRLTSPLVKLMEIASRIAGGERNLLVPVAGPREIAALAQTFNSMTSQLRSVLEGLEQRVAQRTADLEVALAEVQARSQEQTRLLEENAQQRQAIRELSVPVLPVTDDTLVMPLIGAVDSERLANIQERALQAIEQTSAHHLLLDITGVPVVDSQVAQGLLSVAQMARLLGAEAILIGIRPEVAQTIVGLGLDLKSLRTAADLQTILHDIH